MAPTDGIVSDAGWFLHFQPIHYTTIFAHSVITTQSQQGGGCTYSRCMVGNKFNTRTVAHTTVKSVLLRRTVSYRDNVKIFKKF